MHSPALLISCFLTCFVAVWSDYSCFKMGNAFRQQPAPTLYGSNKTPFAGDLVEIGLAVATAMVVFSFFIILPGIRGWEVMRHVYVYEIPGVFITAVVGYGTVFGGTVDRHHSAR